MIDGDVESGSIMAGQSVGMVTEEQPTAVILRELVDQAVAALAAREAAEREVAEREVAKRVGAVG